MIRPPPRSTLFPTRRSSDLRLTNRREALHHLVSGPPTVGRRSEEHTSELQSQSNLVCRLLLEKKKNEDINNPLINISSNPSPSNSLRYTTDLTSIPALRAPS